MICHLQQESQIANMENRNYFSLHCLQMETQLIHANLEILYDVLGDMAAIEARSHSNVSIHEYSLWHGRDMTITKRFEKKGLIHGEVQSYGSFSYIFLCSQWLACRLPCGLLLQ